MIRVGVVDSLCLSAPNLRDFFDENYYIEDVKWINVFEPEVWRKTFGSPLNGYILYAGIIHSNLGLTIPIKRQLNGSFEVVDFAGIHGFNDRSALLQLCIKDLLPLMGDCVVKRLDIAIDMDNIPSRLMKRIMKKGRYKKIVKNSIYFKTKSENKTNRYINIILYDKQKKDKYSPKKYRLELSYRGNSVGMAMKDLVYEKFEKSIKRLTGLDVKITPL